MPWKTCYNIYNAELTNSVLPLILSDLHAPSRIGATGVNVDEAGIEA